MRTISSLLQKRLRITVEFLKTLEKNSVNGDKVNIQKNEKLLSSRWVYWGNKRNGITTGRNSNRVKLLLILVQNSL